jgi:hypothetical protein
MSHWAPIFLATALTGGITGWWVRGMNTQRPTAAQEAFHRGRGEQLIEYFDPGCAASGSLHVLLDEQFQHGGFEHVMVPVAINRLSGSTLADVLCAQPDDHVWALASEWARDPPTADVLQALDPEVRKSCAERVEAATRHIGSLRGAEGRIMTPAVEYRGSVYMGAESTDALLSAIANGEGP